MKGPGTGNRVDLSGWTAHWGDVTPGKTALRFEGRELSYVALEHEIARLAGWLRGRGAGSGDRVAYLGPNCPELLELLCACARLGAIFVPLNNRMPPAELRVFTRSTRPRLLVAEGGFAPAALAAVEDPSCVETFRVGELARLSSAAAPVAATADLDPAAPALILFTSGTTGRPKGATFTYANLAFNALNVITSFALSATDEVLTAVPMFHTGGLLIHTLPALCAGATITIHRDFEPGRILEEIGRRRITLLASVPTMTLALGEHRDWDAADLTSLRCVLTGSTVVPREAVELWTRRGVAVVQGYGGTEATPTAVTMPAGSPPDAGHSAGKPSLTTQIRIVSTTGAEACAGTCGEVWIRGPAVSVGYWENEAATREAFGGGWFRTGDLGRLDEHGRLHVVGRIRDIIIVGASNVHPADVEAVLETGAGVREAAVVGRPDRELGEVPVACVVATATATLTAEQVLGLFPGRLADYKHPRDVLFLSELPRNATGKVDRRALRALVEGAAERPT